MLKSLLLTLPSELLACLKLSPQHALIRSPTRSFATASPRRFGVGSRAVSVQSQSEQHRNEKKKHYYITTPIFYVNAAPHIGHLHSTLLADVYTRFQALRNPAEPPPILCTGTDEHGLKIQRVAEGLGVTPGALCDGVSERFRGLAKKANIRNDIFIRTTEERHKVAVQHVWRELDRRGFIYKSSYAGWYAVSDEAYYGENEVEERVDEVSGEKMRVSIETGTKVEWMEEENYKFRLSAFRERLIEWLSCTTHPLQPPSRTYSLLATLSLPTSTDLQDLSISRPTSRLFWGIRVPDEEEHTIYVWIDALINYLTAAGYPWEGEEAPNKMWPADLMVVGKDIIRFHALYLPAMLLALDLPLPKTILAHGHWTMDRFKMSKSRGNVADPISAMSTYGVDAIRCFLMRRGGDCGNDADYSEEELGRFYKKELQGQLGNLLNRVMGEKMLAKLEEEEGVGKIYERPKDDEEGGLELKRVLEELPATYESHLLSYAPHRALSSIFSALTLSNSHLQNLSPWLSTASPSSVHRALFYSSETLRITAILLSPFMPSKMEEVLDRLGVDEARRGWNDLGLGKGGERHVEKIGGGKSGSATPLFKKVEVVAKEKPLK